MYQCCMNTAVSLTELRAPVWLSLHTSSPVCVLSLDFHEPCQCLHQNENNSLSVSFTTVTHLTHMEQSELPKSQAYRLTIKAFTSERSHIYMQKIEVRFVRVSLSMCLDHFNEERNTYSSVRTYKPIFTFSFFYYPLSISVLKVRLETFWNI